MKSLPIEGGLRQGPALTSRRTASQSSAMAASRTDIASPHNANSANALQMSVTRPPPLALEQPTGFFTTNPSSKVLECLLENSESDTEQSDCCGAPGEWRVLRLWIPLDVGVAETQVSEAGTTWSGWIETPNEHQHSQ